MKKLKLVENRLTTMAAELASLKSQAKKMGANGNAAQKGLKSGRHPLNNDRSTKPCFVHCAGETCEFGDNCGWAHPKAGSELFESTAKSRECIQRAKRRASRAAKKLAAAASSESDAAESDSE